VKEQQIKMFLAREMADCWGMFGEGKLQIFSREFTSKDFTSKGIICSKIEFDKTITGGEGGIEKIDNFILYMATHKVPNQNYSYMDYLRGTPQGESAAQLYGQMVAEDVKKTLQKDSVSIKEVKTIFYIESTISNFWQRIVGGVGAGAGAIGSVQIGGFGFSALTTLGAVFGSSVGDKIQRWAVDESFCIKPEDKKKDERDCVNHVGGLFLTDYSAQGFKDFRIDSFENV